MTTRAPLSFLAGQEFVTRQEASSATHTQIWRSPPARPRRASGGKALLRRAGHAEPLQSKAREAGGRAEARPYRAPCSLQNGNEDAADNPAALQVREEYS